jgi:glyoxylase-like metal-dependent hydrolase (beta-lactamase superfamily II)
MNPRVQSFYDPTTFTFSYVAYDEDGGHAAIVDPVLGFESSTARTSAAPADRVLAFVHEHRLTVDWILETHAHADHLTAAAYLKGRTGGRIAIGRGITQVQERFKALFGLEADFPTDGRQFDRLFADGDTFAFGALEARVIATPGHTDDSLTYVIGDAAFVGDTVFAPDIGTARADFPGGDARKLYRSIRRLFELPAQTRLFLCHDYPPPERRMRAELARGAAPAQRARRTRCRRGHVREDAHCPGCHPRRAQAHSARTAGQHPRRRAAIAGPQRHSLPAPAARPDRRCEVSSTWLLALAGGVLIGLSATLLLWLNGRVAGISGILDGVLFPHGRDLAWRGAFLLGLIAAAGLYMAFVPGAPQPRADFPRAGLVVAGLLVGFGTRMGNGCTSGHGVCGIGRLSVRSLVAVSTFMATAIATTFAMRHLWSWP